VDVELSPVQDFEVASADPSILTAVVGPRSTVYDVGGALVAVPATNWMRQYDFRVGDQWENMFSPNGSGSIAWRLGWTVTIPPSYWLLVLPHDYHPEIGVLPGLLSEAVIARLMNRAGMSIALAPSRPIRVLRGEPIARIVLLSSDSVAASSVENLETNNER
jgi:hypothetical protein